MTDNKKIENNVNSISEEDKKSMEFLKSQEDEVVVIDVPEQKNEVETSEIEKKKKHVNIFKQFLIPRVYYTAIVVYILAIVTKIIVGIILSVLNLTDEDGKSENQEALEDGLKENNYNYKSILYIVLFGPILEEFIFRFILFRGISYIGEKIGKNNKFIRRFIKFLAYIISSGLFAFGHFGFSFEILVADFVNFPTYFIMGVFLAIAYDYDGYFLAAVLTHILNNSIATVVMFFLIWIVYNIIIIFNFNIYYWLNCTLNKNQ